MKHIRTFESKKVRTLPEGCTEVRYQDFLGHIIDAESADRRSKEQGYDFQIFEKFSKYELDRISKIVSRFDGYFTTSDNKNALFLHSVFDPNTSPYLLGFRSGHSLEIPQLVWFRARHSKKYKSFAISKKEDGWFLVHVRDSDSKRSDYVAPGIDGGGGMNLMVGHRGPDTENDFYFVCDQFESLINFLEKETRMYRTYDRESKKSKWEKEKKIKTVTDWMKDMGSDDFNRFYDEFLSKYKR